MVIWPHGKKFVFEILDYVLSFHSVVASQIVRVNLSDFGVNNFVKAIYAHDYAPFEHLKEKTRYLEVVSDTEIFVLFFNESAATSNIFGENSFAHEESDLVRRLKNDIRSQFNPVDSYGSPTHQHVVHFTDSEFQALELAKLVQTISGVKVYGQKRKRLFDWPEHIPIGKWSIKAVDIRSIRATVFATQETKSSSVTEEVSISKTPHFGVLFGNLKPYEEYLSRNLGQGIQDPRTANSFLRNIARWDSGGRLELPLLESRGDGFAQIDGLHRLAYLSARGNKTIRCLVRTSND